MTERFGHKESVMTTFIKIAIALAITIGSVSGTPAADQNKYLTFVHRQLGPFGNGREPGSSSTGLYNPSGSPTENWELPTFGR
jgi:hypothetical protein